MSRACHDCVKCILLFTNTTTLLAGLAVIGFGAYLIIEMNNQLPDMPDAQYVVKLMSYAMFAIGSVTFLISLFGCFGSMFTARCLLAMYAIFMLLLAVAQIVLAGLFLAGTVTKISVTATETAMMKPENYNLINVFQKVGKCCGPNGPEVYAGKTLPPTCCEEKFNGACNEHNVYHKGCKTFISEEVDSVKVPVGCGFIGVATFELLNMIAAIYICFRPVEAVQFVTQVIR